MQCDGERLDNRGEFQGEVRRDGEQVRDRQVDELTEEAGSPGLLRKRMLAQTLWWPVRQILAVVAVEGRFERGAVAGLPAGDAAPGLDHGAGGSWPSTMGYSQGVSPTAPSE